MKEDNSFDDQVFILSTEMPWTVRIPKKRLPRKYKKQVKKVVSAKSATKSVMTMVVTMQSAFQVAMLSSSHGSPALKALGVAQVTIDTAKAITSIMSEKPNSWRDFLR